METDRVSEKLKKAVAANAQLTKQLEIAQVERKALREKSSKEGQQVREAVDMGVRAAIAAGPPSLAILKPSWDGRGSPYLLHLTFAAHVALPPLLMSVVRSVGKEFSMLVGACAWAFQTGFPLGTEDVDIVVFNLTLDDIKAVAVSAVEVGRLVACGAPCCSVGGAVVWL
jgi:hypothetical protein